MTPGNGRKPPTGLHNYRCTNCGRLLFRAFLVEGCRVHIRCPKCGSGLWVESGKISTEQAVMVAAVAG